MREIPGVTVASERARKMEAERIIRASDRELSYRSKHYHEIRVVKDRQLVCGSCGNVAVIEEGRTFSHPVVGILQCEKCQQQFKDLSHAASKNGETYCRICGHSKNLQHCGAKKCSFAFCRTCVKRNASLSLVEIDAETWKCFVCESKPLWELRAVSAAAMASLPKTKRKRQRRPKEPSVVPSYARRKLAKVDELKRLMGEVCDEDTSSTDDRPNFTARHSKRIAMYTSDDLSEFSPGEGPSSAPRKPLETLANQCSSGSETENGDTGAAARGRGVKNGRVSGTTRKRSKSANVTQENARGKSSRSRRSLSATGECDAGSSSGKEFQKQSKVSTDSSMLRKLWSTKKGRPTSEKKPAQSVDGKTVVGKQQRLRFKAKVVKILNRFKDACSEYELKMEHVKWRHFKREMVYRENADTIVERTRKLMSRMRTELEKQERELTGFHRQWTETCVRVGERESTCSSENEIFDEEETKRTSEKESKNEISVSECDGEEIFSDKEENAGNPEDSTKETNVIHEETFVRSQVPSPILGSTKRINFDATKSSREKETTPPFSQNYLLNDSLNDIFETSLEEENAERPTIENNVEEAQINETLNEDSLPLIQRATESPAPVIEKVPAKNAEDSEEKSLESSKTAEAINKEPEERSEEIRSSKDSLNEEERAKRAMLESDSEFQDESERSRGTKSSEEKPEDTPKRTSVDSDDSSSTHNSEQKESDSENVRAKKALLSSSNSESESSESAETTKSKSKNSKLDKKSLKRRHSDSDTSVGARVKKRRLKMDVRHGHEGDKKLRMSCNVAIERLSAEQLKKFAHVLESSRRRSEKSVIDSLIDLEKLERNRNVDSGESESRTTSRTSKKKSRKDGVEEETLLDHLNRVENGEQLMAIEEDDGEEMEKGPVQDSNSSIQTKEELMLEADRATKELLLNSSDSDSEVHKSETGENESEDEEAKSSKKKTATEKSIKTEKSQEDAEKSRWRRNKILTMRLSDSNSEDEKDKWEKKQERLQEKSEDDKLDSDVKEMKKKKQLRRRILDSDSDVQLMDLESDSSVILEEENEDPDQSPKQKKKIRKRTTCKSSDTDSTLGEKKSKPKRRRIKKVASDSESESGSDQLNSSQSTPGKKGRKNIRKVMKNKQVTDDTKQAAKEEEERQKRIDERQKLYNEMYEARLACETKVDKLVLDFDASTKEELVVVHQDLVKRLKPHQAEGIKFMWNACFESLERMKSSRGSGCIIAHCMGLGKTLQVISLAHTLLNHEQTGVRTVMVVCPLSTVLNWVHEFEHWLKDVESPDVDVYELTKLKKNFERKYQLQSWQRTGGVLIIGYEMFRNLSGPNKNIRKNMKEEILKCLIDPGPDVVVCDEGHLLKNEDTALSKCMTKIKTLRRIVLTGTPLQNNLTEYHCMVQFVKPNLLGTKREFLNRFVNPITNGQFDDSTATDVKLMKKRAYVLHKMLKGSVQRFDYSVLMPFLPPKQEYVIFVRLTNEQIKMYRHYLDNFARRHRGAGGSLFADFQALQRIWTHPLVLRLNAERIERTNERKRLSASESEGSLKDFINDDSESDSWHSSSSSSSASTDDDVQEISDSNKEANKEANKETNKEAGKEVGTTSSRRRNTEPEVVEVTAEAEEITEDKNWWSQYIQTEQFDDMHASAKLLLLFGILKECEQIGDKVLVFSQSLYSLTLIETFLGKIDEAAQAGENSSELDGHSGSWSLGLDYFRLDGQTSAENRNMWCKIFNRPTNTRARLFLISTRAGGLGINLTAANRVIILDASWNPSHDVQSIFRIYRFGQKKPCYVYRFLAAGTMEEKIYNRQVTKLSLSCRVVDEQQIERHYSNNDLNELYKFEVNVSDAPATLNLPKDRLLAEIFLKYKGHVENYHEHDSLLENKAEEELDEEERKQAWLEYEEEKKGRPLQVYGGPLNSVGTFQAQMLPNQFGIKQPHISAQDYDNLQQLIRKDYPNATPEQQKAITTRAFMEMYNYLEQQVIVQAANSYNPQPANRVKQVAMRPQMHKVVHTLQNPQTLQAVPNMQNMQNVQNVQNLQNAQNLQKAQTTQSGQNTSKNLVPNIYVPRNNDAGGSASMDDDIVELPTNVTTSQNPTQSKGKNQEE